MASRSLEQWSRPARVASGRPLLSCFRQPRFGTVSCRRCRIAPPPSAAARSLWRPPSTASVRLRALGRYVRPRRLRMTALLPKRSCAGRCPRSTTRRSARFDVGRSGQRSAVAGHRRRLSTSSLDFRFPWARRVLSAPRLKSHEPLSRRAARSTAPAPTRASSGPMPVSGTRGSPQVSGSWDSCQRRTNTRGLRRSRQPRATWHAGSTTIVRRTRRATLRPRRRHSSSSW